MVVLAQRWARKHPQWHADARGGAHADAGGDAVLQTRVVMRPHRHGRADAGGDAASQMRAVTRPRRRGR